MPRSHMAKSQNNDNANSNINPHLYRSQNWHFIHFYRMHFTGYLHSKIPFESEIQFNINHISMLTVTSKILDLCSNRPTLLCTL